MRKSKTNRLFYLTVSKKGITKINSADVLKAKSAVKSGDAQYSLHAVYAKDIEEARRMVIGHKSERYFGNISAYDRMIEEHGYSFSGIKGTGLGYKGWDEEGAINATIKAIDKFQGKPAYIAATYTGIKTTSIKPPFGQQYYRVNPDGSVDFIQHLKGKTTEERIRNPKGQMTLFGIGKHNEIKLWRHCGWCKRFLDKDNNYIPEPQKPYETTDTICPSCQVKFLKEYGLEPKQPKKTLLGVPYFESGTFEPDLTKNQIRVRILNPRLFRSYFIRHSSTPGVQYAMGTNDKGNVLTQSIRFSKKLFDLQNARRWFTYNIDRIIKRDLRANLA